MKSIILMSCLLTGLALAVDEYCFCDFEEDACDLNCCCDLDCSHLDAAAFSFCLEPDPFSRPPTEYTRICSTPAFNIMFINFYQTAQDISPAAPLLCFQERFSPDSGRIRWRNGRNIRIENSWVVRSEKSLAAGAGSRTSKYKAGDDVLYAMHASSTNNSIELHELRLPSFCKHRRVRFMIGNDETCVVRLGDDASCSGIEFLPTSALTSKATVFRNPSTAINAHSVANFNTSSNKLPDNGPTEEPVDTSWTEVLGDAAETVVGSSFQVITTCPTLSNATICPYSANVLTNIHEQRCDLFASSARIVFAYSNEEEIESDRGIYLSCVHLTLSNASFGDVLTMRYSVSFVKFEEERLCTEYLFPPADPSSYPTSGNPGYLMGKPLVAGFLDRDIVIVDPNPNRWISLAFTSASELQGACNPFERRLVVFGHQMTTTCVHLITKTQVGSLAKCDVLRRSMFDILIGRNVFNRVAAFGNTIRNDLTSWIQINEATPPPEANNNTSPLTCSNIPFEVEWNVIWSRVGHVAAAQNKISAVSRSFKYRTVSFNCFDIICPPASLEQKTLIATSRVRFVDISISAAASDDHVATTGGWTVMGQLSQLFYPLKYIWH